MEIKIERYLNDSEIKEIVQDELRIQIRKFFSGTEENTQRLLSNLAYAIVRDEVDKIVPNYEEELVNKVAELIKGKDLSFHVCRKRNNKPRRRRQCADQPLNTSSVGLFCRRDLALFKPIEGCRQRL